MKRFSFWIRWVVLVPLVAAVYLSVQVCGVEVGVLYLQREIIDDAPGTYEVSSHFLWDWILHPLSFVFVGVATASIALEVSRAVAPSLKTQTARVVAAVLVLYGFGNVVFALILMHAGAVLEPFSAVGVNLGVAVTGLLYSLRLKRQQVVVFEEAVQR